VNSIISASKLTRRFGSLTAVDRLDLEIAAGEIFALVGPDGAGKTTTMRLLCGLMDPTTWSRKPSWCGIKSGTWRSASVYIRI
jgi:ABC-2 type transport system ATP-binding protein